MQHTQLNSDDLQALRSRVFAILQSAPWAHVVSDEQRSAWFDATLQSVGPVEIVWHAYRATGIGGSDVGSIMANLVGEHAFSTIEEILSSKFLLTVPTPSEGHTARGHYMEAFMEKASPAQLGAQRDVESFDLINGFTPKSDRPYHRVNIDDLFITEDGKRILVDYKSPMDVATFLRADNPIAYVSQLHYYRQAAVELGVDIDQMVLAVPDLADWVPRFKDVPYSAELDKQITSVCDHIFHDYLMQGAVPEDEAQMVVAADGSDRTQAMAEEFITLHSIAAAATKRADEIKGEMRQAALLDGLSEDSAIATPFAKVTLKHNVGLDDGGIKALLKTSGMSASDFMVTKTTEVFDAQAAFDTLQAAQRAGDIPSEIDLEKYKKASPTITVRATRAGKKNEWTQMVAMTSDAAKELVGSGSGHLVSTLRSQVESVKQSEADASTPNPSVGAKAANG